MKLINYAKRELALIGETEGEDGEMQRMMNDNIIQLITVFSEQEHSGFSAGYLINALERLMRFKPLTPLTGEDDEWNEVSDNIEQNKRCSSVFRKNHDNATAYDNNGKVFSDDGGKTWFVRGGTGSSVPVTFPYYPPTKPERVLLSESED